MLWKEVILFVCRELTTLQMSMVLIESDVYFLAENEHCSFFKSWFRISE